MFPEGSVAVAVRNGPGDGTGRVTSKGTVPVPPVVTSAEPRNAPPSRSRGVACGAREELEPEEGARRAGQCALYGGVAAGRGAGGQQRRVLKLIRATVSVARIVSGNAVGRQVDPEPPVLPNLVSEQPVPAARGDEYSVRAVEGDPVSCTGGRSADRVPARAVLDQDTVSRVAPRPHAVRRRADEVALDHVPGRRRIGDPDPVGGVGRDEIAVTGRGATDHVVHGPVVDLDAVVPIGARDVAQAGEDPDPVAPDHVAGRTVRGGSRSFRCRRRGCP